LFKKLFENGSKKDTFVKTKNTEAKVMAKTTEKGHSKPSQRFFIVDRYTIQLTINRLELLVERCCKDFYYNVA